MPKLVSPLTDIQVKNAKPKDKPYKLADGGGMYLEVTPTGSKLWRMKFKQATGKESRLAFGSYPEVSLRKTFSRILARYRYRQSNPARSSVHCKN